MTWTHSSNNGMSLQVSEDGLLCVAPTRETVSQPTNNLASLPTLHSCIFCTFTTNQLIEFRLHMKTHTQGSFFLCPECPYKTDRSNNMKKHLFTHTGERPYECSECCYSTNNNSNLKLHLRKQHNII